ncbi:NAD(P)-dependent oxidoreductase [Tersicoccus sp. MR15.9]|uniref:NAD(P)-dependent oxidoreductase n=1 Tax=Tersicoccus mangrovi TaxID=3121635 RepID=UPI002FE589EC
MSTNTDTTSDIAPGRSRVAVLGTGTMGAAMARRLLGAGFAVTAWNRTAERAEALADDGARVATDPADAVGDADVVLTMLFDADAVLETAEAFLPALPDGAVWMQSSTTGVEGAHRIAQVAEKAGVALVDAPVLGTLGPAEQGKLTVLAAGAREPIDRLAPVFGVVGSRTVPVGERHGDASALKLAVNVWLGTLTAATAQSLAITQAFDLDPDLFLTAIDGTPTDSPYAHVKGSAMLADERSPQFALDGLRKDLTLAQTEASAVRGDLLAAVIAAFDDAADAGRGGEDINAVSTAFDVPEGSTGSADEEH